MAASLTSVTTATVGTALDNVCVVPGPHLDFTISGGTPVSFELLLEGSIDNSTWITLASTSSAKPADALHATAYGTLIASGFSHPRYVRANLTSITQPSTGVAASVSANVFGN